VFCDPTVWSHWVTGCPPWMNSSPVAGSRTECRLRQIAHPLDQVDFLFNCPSVHMDIQRPKVAMSGRAPGFHIHLGHRVTTSDTVDEQIERNPVVPAGQSPGCRTLRRAFQGPLAKAPLRPIARSAKPPTCLLSRNPYLNPPVVPGGDCHPRL